MKCWGKIHELRKESSPGQKSEKKNVKPKWHSLLVEETSDAATCKTLNKKSKEKIFFVEKLSRYFFQIWHGHVIMLFMI